MLLKSQDRDTINQVLAHLLILTACYAKKKELKRGIGPQDETSINLRFICVTNFPQHESYFCFRTNTAEYLTSSTGK